MLTGELEKKLHNRFTVAVKPYSNRYAVAEPLREACRQPDEGIFILSVNGPRLIAGSGSTCRIYIFPRPSLTDRVHTRGAKREPLSAYYRRRYRNIRWRCYGMNRSSCTWIGYFRFDSSTSRIIYRITDEYSRKINDQPDLNHEKSVNSLKQLNSFRCRKTQQKNTKKNYENSANLETGGGGYGKQMRRTLPECDSHTSTYNSTTWMCEFSGCKFTDDAQEKRFPASFHYGRSWYSFSFIGRNHSAHLATASSRRPT